MQSLDTADERWRLEQLRQGESGSQPTRLPSKQGAMAHLLGQESYKLRFHERTEHSESVEVADRVSSGER